MPFATLEALLQYFSASLLNMGKELLVTSHHFTFPRLAHLTFHSTYSHQSRQI
jgi:hypothetical protein